MMILEMGIFYRLLLAHVIGDFMLQSSQLVSKRFSNNKNIRIRANLTHSLLHALLSLFFLGQYLINKNIVIIIGLVALLTACHFLIDLFKSSLTNRKNYKQYNILLFCIDQGLHLISIIFISLLIGKYYSVSYNSMSLFKSIEAWLNQTIQSTTYEHKLFISIILLIIGLWGVGIFIKLFFDYTHYKFYGQVSDNNYFEHNYRYGKKGTENGGFYIGLLERLFIISVIALRIPEVIGFVLATKSIARFKEFDNDKFVEDFIIGSFISFISAIIIGVIIEKLNVIPY